MRRSALVRIGMTAGGAVMAALVVSAPLRAQLAVNRTDERVLFLLPRSQSPSDSGYAVELADEVRRRMRSEFRQKLATVPTSDVCTVLEESAYPCTMVLGPADAERLANAVQADAYVVGEIWRRAAAPVGRFRLVDVRRSGLSGWMTVEGMPADPPRRFAQAIVDSLQNQVRAAEWARECSERRDRGDFHDAKERAGRVFRMYPNHPSAAMCAWVVSEALQEPIDSQMGLLERATRGDSLFVRAWERLGQARMRTGDSTAALEAFEWQTRLNQADRELRVGVIMGALAVHDHERARGLAADWLQRNPSDVEMLQLETRACVEGGMWECALSALSAQYAADSALASDSAFYQQAIGAAQALGDPAVELEWSSRAVAAFPQSVSLLRAHASALAGTNMTDSVVAVYERLLEMDPTDVRSALAGARMLLDDMVIDTATPVDTARLFHGGRFLERAFLASQDESVLMNVSLLYFRKGSELVRAQKLIPTAVDWLQMAIDTDVRGQLTTQANFFLGLGLMFRVFEFDPQVTETQSCDLVEEEARMVSQGITALSVAGAEFGEDQVAPYMQQFRAFEQRIPQLREAYGCR